MNKNFNLKEPVDRIKLFRTILDRDIEELVKTEKNCQITWPAYCAVVDSLKEFIFAAAGYASFNEAECAGKDGEVHDLACRIADSILDWMQGK